MVSPIVTWTLNSFCLIFCGLASVYFILCLNPVLMKDVIALWGVLLLMGVLSVLELVYFLLFMVFTIINNKELAYTFTKLLLLYDPLVQVLSNLAFIIVVFIFDPVHGSDDGILQEIIIFLVASLKGFLTYSAILFNKDNKEWPGPTQDLVEVSDRKALYTFVPTKDQDEPAQPTPSAQPVYLIPVQAGQMPFYVMKH